MGKQIDILRFADGSPIHPEWRKECRRWRGVVLRGWFAHWCHDWDGLPVDETTPEFSCCSCWSNSFG